MEVPQSGISRVVQPLILSFRKHVWDQAILNVVGKCAQDVSSFDLTARNQGQPFQTDHCVSSPIGEPVVARDHSANLIAGRLCSGFVSDTCTRCDDELVCGKDQLRRPTGLYFTQGNFNELSSPNELSLQGFFRLQCENLFP